MGLGAFPCAIATPNPGIATIVLKECHLGHDTAVSRSVASVGRHRDELFDVVVRGHQPKQCCVDIILRRYCRQSASGVNDIFHSCVARFEESFSRDAGPPPLLWTSGRARPIGVGAIETFCTAVTFDNDSGIGGGRRLLLPRGPASSPKRSGVGRGPNSSYPRRLHEVRPLEIVAAYPAPLGADRNAACG